jgi:hypothetical protein
MLKLKLVLDEPALLLESEDRTLVVADLHIGFEKLLAERGIRIPSQVGKFRDRLMSLYREHGFSRLILLGDVKHEIAGASLMEYAEIPGFLEELAEHFAVEVIPGNHDGGIDKLLPSKVKLHPSKGIILGRDKKAGLTHGHAWPRAGVFRTDYLIMAHNHLCVEFSQAGYRVYEQVWMKGRLEPRKLRRAYRRYSGGDVEVGNPEVVVLPAFNPLLGGLAVNKQAKSGFLGPLFTSESIRLEESRFYLLDGTNLGSYRDLLGAR